MPPYPIIVHGHLVLCNYEATVVIYTMYIEFQVSNKSLIFSTQTFSYFS